MQAAPFKSEIHFNISDMILGAVIFIYVALILLSSKILKIFNIKLLFSNFSDIS